MRAPRTATCLLVAGLALTGCTGSGDLDVDPSGSASALPTGDPSDQSLDVAFTDCQDQAFACSGDLQGTPYDIRLPDTWNGTLLIYSHGFRAADPLTADDPKFEPIAEPAPGVASGVDAVAEALVEQGYALAGAGSPIGGWQLDDAIEAMTTVRGAFVTNVGVPNRIYTWGQSVGGLAALQVAQTQAWATASASMCGVLAGLNPNFDLALDAGVGVKALLEPSLVLTGFKSLKQAQRAYAKAVKAVQKAADDPTGEGLVSLRVIAEVAQIPTKTRMSPGRTPDEQRTALVENLSRVLARTTVERYGIEAQFDGNPSTNAGVNYGARVTADAAADIDASGGVGATLARVRDIAGIPAVQADPDARAAADAAFPRPGILAKPTLTMHTAQDPAAILANETLYGIWAAGASGEDIRWLNINVAEPPALYPEEGGAPYGVGHCSFTGQSIVGGIQILDDWARLGRFPTWSGNTAAFGAASGFAGPVTLPAWPQSPTTLAMVARSPEPDPSPSPFGSPVPDFGPAP
ncbi:MAG: DUF6351 family protein [Candidatus Nanopelagicales bacterium]